MSTHGYDKQRFPNLQGEIFDCIICSCVVKTPKQCTGCGNLFCGVCIQDWKKKNATCPNRCAGNINPMTSKALMNIYNDLDIKCSKGCYKTIKLIDLIQHEENCGKVKCWNNDICDNAQNKAFSDKKPSCSQKCQFLNQLLNSNGNVGQMYKSLLKYKPRQIISKIGGGSIAMSSGQLKWDTSSNCGQGLQFQQNGALVFLKQTAYVFRTAICTTGFASGLHYWEIIADSRTENQLKIGVSKSNTFDPNTAFCDHAFGYAFYGLGQLRHGSNASGPQFGKRFKKQGVLGVFLNMDKGTLAFSLNGQSMGVAYTDVALTKGPIYPAVSLLHCAGCTIKGQLPIPSIFK